MRTNRLVWFMLGGCLPSLLYLSFLFLKNKNKINVTCILGMKASTLLHQCPLLLSFLYGTDHPSYWGSAALDTPLLPAEKQADAPMARLSVDFHIMLLCVAVCLPTPGPSPSSPLGRVWTDWRLMSGVWEQPGGLVQAVKALWKPPSLPDPESKVSWVVTWWWRQFVGVTATRKRIRVSTSIQRKHGCVVKRCTQRVYVRLLSDQFSDVRRVKLRDRAHLPPLRGRVAVRRPTDTDSTLLS